MIFLKNRLFAVAFFAFLALAGIALMPSCSTDFEVYAPEEEIRVVYAVLDPTDSVQYIRVAEAFQYEGDVYAYAADQDLSLKNLSVRITGNGITYTATQIDSFPKEAGIFNPYTTIYRITTDGSGLGKERLVEGQTYTLEIGTSDAEDYVTAFTTIPALPDIGGSLSLTAGAGNSTCLPRLFLDRDFNVEWKKGTASSFELRVYFDYFNNGVPERITWGPTRPLDSNKGCTAGSANLCFKFEERALINFFLARMSGGPFTYDSGDSCVVPPIPVDSLPRPLIFEVTAIDSFLTSYMSSNDPAFLDLTGTKPEYTNLSGNIQAVGVFGSINIEQKAAIMRECSEWLLSLNGRLQPVGCER